MVRFWERKPDPNEKTEKKLLQRYRNWLAHALRDLEAIPSLSKGDLIEGFLREFRLLAPGPRDKEEYEYKKRAVDAFINYVNSAFTDRSLTRPEADRLMDRLFANEAKLLYITDTMKAAPDEIKEIEFVDPRGLSGGKRRW